jgi:hypothetical protein
MTLQEQWSEPEAVLASLLVGHSNFAPAGEPEVQLNPKKKVFEELAPSLKTDATGIAVYQVGSDTPTSVGK